MYYCPRCRKPIWDTLAYHDMTTNVRLSEYCQCPRIAIYLDEYCLEVVRSLSRQLSQPTKTAAPPAIYDAFSDEEVSL